MRLRKLGDREADLATEVSSERGISFSLVEKDAHVADAVRLVCRLGITEDGVRTIFCGGTCLSQAYGILERISEDADFKVVLPDGLSRSQSKKRLSALKHRVISGMEEAGFGLAERSLRARNENRYITAEFEYATDYTADGSMRGEPIKVELTTNNDLLDKTETRPLLRIIDRHGGPDARGLADTTPVEVIGLAGTMAEKTVAYLRRTAQWRAGLNRGEYDEYLIRHVYDVGRLVDVDSGIRDRVAPILAGVVRRDAQQFRNQFPQFAEENPYDILRDELFALRDDPDARQRYRDFLMPMVYSRDKPGFKEASDSFIQVVADILEQAERFSFERDDGRGSAPLSGPPSEGGDGEDDDNGGAPASPMTP